MAQNYIITGNVNPGRHEVQNKKHDVAKRLDQGSGLGATIREIVANGVRFTFAKAQGSTTKNIDPLVLDLNGNGIELTDWVSGSVFFDMTGDGKTHQTGWTADGDGA
ncbi:hypothetical protein [Nitrobacter sp. TKz-YC02]|uniref:hypothetical protein n=1 Tax=Nitrobacter sp. TKz-YC02 TaxID=3398704 RepID=UPI003CFB042B